MYPIPFDRFRTDETRRVHELDVQIDSLYGFRYLKHAEPANDVQELPIFITGKVQLTHLGYAVHARALDRKRRPISLILKMYDGRIDQVTAAGDETPMRPLFDTDNQAYLTEDPNLHGFNDAQLSILKLEQHETAMTLNSNAYKAVKL